MAISLRHHRNPRRRSPAAAAFGLARLSALQLPLRGNSHAWRAARQVVTVATPESASIRGPSALALRERSKSNGYVSLLLRTLGFRKETV